MHRRKKKESCNSSGYFGLKTRARSLDTDTAALGRKRHITHRLSTLVDTHIQGTQLRFFRSRLTFPHIDCELDLRKPRKKGALRGCFGRYARILFGILILVLTKQVEALHVPQRFRFSPSSLRFFRNHIIASLMLPKRHFGTLTFDLRTQRHEATCNIL